jgi:DNA-binding transcriptional ArsR family regulator
MAKKKITIDDPERVLMFGIALAHPLRIRVLVAHARIGSASATMLSEDGLGTLGNVSYHQVKLRNLGALKLVGSRPKQGAIERQYDLSDFGKEIARTAAAIGRRR